MIVVDVGLIYEWTMGWQYVASSAQVLGCMLWNGALHSLVN